MAGNRGYFGIGIYHPKFDENVGGLWRSAHALGAAFIFTIGARYKHQPTDTTKAHRHIPLFEYSTYACFSSSKPRDCAVIGVEMAADSLPLSEFVHYERSIYLLGAEDAGLDDVIHLCDGTIEIASTYCLNVATAGAIVMYDRSLGREHGIR